MHRRLSVLALTVFLSVPCSAAPITGSFVFSAYGTILDDTDLATSMVFTPIGVVTPGVTTGLTYDDYSPIPPGISGAGGAIDIADLSAFELTFIFGMFEASKGSVVSQSADFAEFYFSGVFTPAGGGALAGFDPAPAEVRVSLTKSGAAVSYAGSLASAGPDPFVETPEPDPFALIGLGLVAVWAFRRRTA